MQNPSSIADSSSGSRSSAKPVATIVGWSVTGHDRVTGKLVDAQGESRGRVITSPVLRVYLMPGDGKALALTRSGTMYILVHPACDASQAQDFLNFKARPQVLRASIGTERRLDLPSAQDEPTTVTRTPLPRR